MDKKILTKDDLHRKAKEHIAHLQILSIGCSAFIGLFGIGAFIMLAKEFGIDSALLELPVFGFVIVLLAINYNRKESFRSAIEHYCYNIWLEVVLDKKVLDGGETADAYALYLSNGQIFHVGIKDYNLAQIGGSYYLIVVYKGTNNSKSKVLGTFLFDAQQYQLDDNMKSKLIEK